MQNNYETITIDGKVYDLVPRTTTENAITERPKNKYRANGACLERVGRFQSYWAKMIDGSIGADCEQGTDIDNEKFLSANYFDTEEKAQAWADKLKIYYEIKLRLEQINAGEDWVADVNDIDQIKSNVHKTNKGGVMVAQGYIFIETFTFCPKAKDYFESLPAEKQQIFLQVQCA